MQALEALHQDPGTTAGHLEERIRQNCLELQRQILEREMQRRADSVAWDGDGEVVVTGRWAYSVTAPDDIRHATVRLAAYLYRQKDNAAGDLDRTVVVGGTTILPAVFPHDVERMLRPYRRVTV